MNLSPKSIVALVIVFAGMVSCNAMLAVRDSGIMEQMSARQQQLCKIDSSYCKWFEANVMITYEQFLKMWTELDPQELKQPMKVYLPEDDKYVTLQRFKPHGDIDDDDNTAYFVGI